MSEQSQESEQADTVEEFATAVEETSDGYAVTVEADGESSVVETHAEREDAERQADIVEQAATRYDGAAREEPVPDNYPGKGVDER